MRVSDSGPPRANRAPEPAGQEAQEARPNEDRLPPSPPSLLPSSQAPFPASSTLPTLSTADGQHPPSYACCVAYQYEVV